MEQEQQKTSSQDERQEVQIQTLQPEPEASTSPPIQKPDKIGIQRASSLAYDSVNQQVICVPNNKSQAQQSADEQDQRDGKLIFFGNDDQQDKEQVIPFFESNKLVEIEGKEQGKSRYSAGLSESAAVDHFSVLRFIKSHKAKGIEISPSGLTLKMNKTSSKKGSEASTEELVLTNMAFSSGLHFWEFHATVSCQNLQMGVYNPVTKQELLNSFKTSTMRVITVCLDFNDESVKFWLNERRSQTKTLKLPKAENGESSAGPWIPCVRISGDKNKIILNPYAKEPFDFYEKEFDKKLTLKKFVMPLLHNMICVLRLPLLKEQEGKIAQQISTMLGLNLGEVQSIPLPLLSEESQKDENSRFIFIKFHDHLKMAQFIWKTKGSKTVDVDIYQQGEIASWICDKKAEDLPPDLLRPVTLIKKYLRIPSSSLPDLKDSFISLYHSIESVVKTQTTPQAQASAQDLQISSHPFTDKLLLVQDQKTFKILSRDQKTQEFDFEQASFREGLTNLESIATVLIQLSALKTFFLDINWALIMKDEEPLVLGLVKDFLNQAAQSLVRMGSVASFSVGLVTAKYTLDLAQKTMQSQLEKLKRKYQNNQTLIATESLVRDSKLEVPFGLLKDEAFAIRQDLSVDEVYAVLHLLSDVSEQIWTQAKGSKTSSETKIFLQSVSRPHSALNRLGSLLNWSVGDLDYLEVAELGFIYKENHTVSQVGSLGLELHDLSRDQLLNREKLVATLGHGNRFLNGDITENVPLANSLNYLPARSFPLAERVVDVIHSQNNVYSLVCSASGSVAIHSSLIDFTLLKKLDFFSSEKTRSVNRMHEYMKKVQQRITQLSEYNKHAAKKLVPLSILKNKPLPASPKITVQEKKQALEKNLKQDLMSKAMKLKHLKNKKQKKPLKVNQKNMPHDEEINAESEDESKPKPQQTESSTLDSEIDASKNDIKVIGYFLLSRPYLEKAVDPVTVGCIFENTKTLRFYLRVVKMAFSVGFLHPFIHIDQSSGLIINRLTGKLVEDCEDLATIYEDIINHSDCLFDLFPLFMQKDRGSHKSIKTLYLVESAKASIEIENCKEVIDFTRCSYSIGQQDRVYVLVKSEGGQTVLQQFNIKGERIDKLLNYKVSITKGKEMEVDDQPSRVFQYEESLCLVGKTNYHIITQSNFKVEKVLTLKEEIEDFQAVDIVNKTEASQLYCKSNQIKFKNGAQHIPKQKWDLITPGNHQSIINSYSLDPQGEKNETASLKQSDEIQNEVIDLSKCDAQDLLLIPGLIKSDCQGFISKQNANSIQNAFSKDEANNLQLRHNWHITNTHGNQKQEFEFIAPRGKGQEQNLKEIQIEFSLIKKSSDKIRLRIQKDSQGSQHRAFSELAEQKLPLLVDFNSGAQINDALLACQIVNPDSTVFCTNYARPEFIFKHIHEHSFIPTQFVIRSKENREWSGVPIGQGLIFVSNSLVDLHNTKAFAKFTREDYEQWKTTRNQLRDLPLLPNEPVAFFDMEDLNEAVVDVKLLSSFKFIKLLPISFREQPINFQSKPFNSNQLEIQFFGVNGYDLGFQAEGSLSESKVQEISKAMIQDDLTVALKGELTAQGLGIISTFEKLALNSIKSPRSESQELNLAALLNLSVSNVTYKGVYKISLTENQCNIASHFKLSLDTGLCSDQWQVSDVSVTMTRYASDSTTFKSEHLERIKPKLRQHLIDDSMFETLLVQLLEISKTADHAQDQRKEAALECILKHLEQRPARDLVAKIQKRVKLEDYLKEDFIDNSRGFQTTIISFLEKIGILSSESAGFTLNFIQQQLGLIFQHQRPIGQVQSLFQLTKFLTQEQRGELSKVMVKLLDGEIIRNYLPKYQTEEYVKLRSKLNINLFPLDSLSIDKLIPTSQNQSIEKIAGAQCRPIANKILVSKYNNVNQYNIEMAKNHDIQKITLTFEQETKGLYKIMVRVIVPDSQGRERIAHSRLFDEVYFQQVCDKSVNPRTQEYFHSRPEYSHEVRSEDQAIDKESLQINKLALHLNLRSLRFFKIQVEFMDTYRTIHKQVNMTQIFIRPEVFGHMAKDQSIPENIKLFAVPEIERDLKIETIKSKDCSMDVFLISSSQLSHGQKQCIIEVTYPDKQLQSTQPEKTEENETQKAQLNQEEANLKLQEIKNLQTQLRQILNSKSESKNKIRRRALEIMGLEKQISQAYEQQLSLSYMLKLSETVAGQILVLKPQAAITETLEDLDSNQLFLALFKHFSVYDIKHLYPHIHKILDLLLERISDKTQFVCKVFQAYLLEANTFFSQKNVITFIKTMKHMDINEIVTGFAHMFQIQLHSEQESSAPLQLEDIDRVIVEVSQVVSKDEAVQIQAALAFFSIVDDLAPSVKGESLRMDNLVKVSTDILKKLYLADSKSVGQETYVDIYVLEIFNKFLATKNLDFEAVIQNCQQEFVYLLMLSFKKNDKAIQKSFKQLLQTLSQSDSSGRLLQSMSVALQWFQHKQNEVLMNFYKIFGKEHESTYFRQYVKVFKLIGLVQSKSPQTVSKAEESLSPAPESLSIKSMVEDLLTVLVESQDDAQYEEKFFFIWKILFNQCLLGGREELIQKIITQMLKLKPLILETLYPTLLSKAGKLLKEKTYSDECLIFVVHSLLRTGFSQENNQQRGVPQAMSSAMENVVYSFADCLLNILVCSTPYNFQVNSPAKSLSPQDALRVTQLLCRFLKSQLNDGSYSGLNGALQLTNMKLKLANKLAQILSHPQSPPKTAAEEAQTYFTRYLSEKKFDEEFETIVETLIQWSFHNYNVTKHKASASGCLIISLCQSVDSILSKISLHQEAVFKALPILMRNVLKIDYKLRDLVLEDKVNQNKLLNIQKNVNELFLLHFKSWIATDEIAKSFLTELQGFDFLLDRLFSQEAETSQSAVRKIEELKKASSPEEEEKLDSISTFPLFSDNQIEDAVNKDETSSEEEDEEDNQLLNLVLEKLKVKKPSKDKQKSDQSKDLQEKKMLKKLPMMVKQEGINTTEQAVAESNDSDKNQKIEQKLTLDDWGKSVTLYAQGDNKPVTVQHDNMIWLKFKQGRYRVVNCVLSEQQLEYELTLDFDLGQVLQIQEIQTGVVYNWTTYDQDQNYEPLTLIVEGGIEKDKVSFRSFMVPVRDYGYELNQNRPYVASLNPLAQDLNQRLPFEDQISQFAKKEARYLRLRFRRVVQTMLDGSSMTAQMTKQKSFGVSYLSIMGSQHVNHSHFYNYMLELQKDNSLEVLSKFFSGEFTQAFEIISEQPQIIDKIKNAFDKLAVLLESKAALVKPIFLAICKKNELLGDWIMTNRLQKLNPSLIKKEQIEFLGDIISSNKETQYLKLLGLKEFIVQSLKTIVQDSVKDQDTLALFRRYIRLFNSKLRELSNHLSETSEESPGLEIPLSEEECKLIVTLLSQQAIPYSLWNDLVKMLVSLVNPQFGFANNSITALEVTKRVLEIEDAQQMSQLIQIYLFSIFASFDKTTLDYLISKEFISTLYTLIEKHSINIISDQSQSQNLFILSQIIYNLCQIPETFDLLTKHQAQSSQKGIIDWTYTRLLNQLRNQSLQSEGDQKSAKIMLVSAVNDETLTLLVDSVSLLLISSPSDQERYAQILQEDMKQASVLGDIRFISKVVVPLIHSEKLINIKINILPETQESANVCREKPFYLGQKTQGVGESFFLKTSLLNPRQKKVFETNFKQITQDHLDVNALLKSNWSLVYSESNIISKSQADFVKFVKAVSNKSNVIILVKASVNNVDVIYGGFTAQQFPNLSDSITQEFDYQVPFAESNFVFSYHPDKEQHFTMQNQKAFGYIYTDFENSGALSISGDFFLISWSHEFSSNCGNLYDMKCLEDPVVASQYSNMTVSEFEVWHCDPSSKAKLLGQSTNLKSEIKKIPFCNKHTPLKYIEQNIIFKVSEGLTLQQLGHQIMHKELEFIKVDELNLDQSLWVTNKYNKLRDLIKKEDQARTIHKLVIQKDSVSEQKSDNQKSAAEEVIDEKVESVKPLLNIFIQRGGIIELLDAAKASVATFKNKEIQSIWMQWLQEIEAFNAFPNFYNLFSQDQQKERVIYQLLSGENDCPINDVDPSLKTLVKTQEDLHLQLITYTYKILSNLFDTQESSELRDLCLKNGTIMRFIERIGHLTSENKRSKVQLKEEVIVQEKLEINQGSDNQKKENMLEQDKVKVRKGVGYTTGVGTAWNVTEYLKSKQSKNQQIANIMNILSKLIKPHNWEAPREVKEMILESALLPALEAGFRSGSLLEMAKDFELNMSYLEFVKELSGHQELMDLLMDIGEDYEPRQKETVYELLKKIASLSSIFLSCLNTDGADKSQDTEESKKPKMLAERIIETLKLVDQKLKASEILKKQQSLEEILAMPLSEAYSKLLSDLRFENMKMKNSTGVYRHHYLHDIPKGLNPPVSKLVRLAQEIADLSNSLPCDWTNAIFCRVDEERVDVMKCLIMGAAGTPYAHGAFVYDLFFENSYPNSPPKCTLVTTGGGTVRFNPNLYTNGKVCLSLLGTWRGSSTENWDPKLSTILQVLLSVQAIIMSSEVYFNEPGYEHEQGTVEGEKKNEGYANIVRYCNVKFAMIDAIKNPPAGFEKVIKRSFYLKKNEILKEVKEWVERSRTTEATYQGLVYDHNYHWAPQISPEGKYTEMMEAVYSELKETLESIPSPFEDEGGVQIERKFSDTVDLQASIRSKDVKLSTEAGQNMQLDDIDVSFAPSSTDKVVDQNIDVEDEKVKDRWSRYIGAMGIEAVAKQAQSRILVHGLDALGVEIAKNIILAGCKELILDDKTEPEAFSINGQFFIEQKDVKTGQSLAQITGPKLQQLNFYVKVSLVDRDTELSNYINSQQDLKVVVISKLCSRYFLYEINRICREKGIAFIYAAQNGVMSKVFTDFGPEFKVIDKDGEELQEVLIKDIYFDETSNSSVVELLDGYKHRFQDGDVVLLKEVKGMTKSSDMSLTLNNQASQIKVINPRSFKITDVDVREYSSYEGSGIAKQVKVPVELSFKTLVEAENSGSPLLDQNLQIYDFTKIENQTIIHDLYKLMQELMDEEEQFKVLSSSELREEFFKMLAKKEDSEDKEKRLKELIDIFTLTFRNQLPPACAYLGGVVSQEIVKAITQKYMPINQFFYFDCLELFPVEKLSEMLKKDKEQHKQESKKQYQDLEQILGHDLMWKVFDCKLFMIGAGAIGCELLKNYAMLGLGTGASGQIVLTDPDVIEVSNLNRQFLFREKHLRKPKSSTAAAAAIQMNPGLKSHVIARLDKIHDGTASIYNEDFFKNLDIVTNALDNVAARLYIDGKCVASRTPLIDSGTLGPKGHVQIVLPKFKTESYASQSDPEDNNEIPHCTLKMFPEEILHCIEWAKDIFGKLFTIKPQLVNKYLESDAPINFADQQEVSSLKKALQTLSKDPSDFRECIKLARARFQKHFVNDIKQLLHVYPIDKVTKDGRPFWSLPKRPPHAVQFDKKNSIHVGLVSSCACLIATVYGVTIPYDNPRSQEAKLEMASIADEFDQPAFIPNDLKASEIQSQVEKDPTKDASVTEGQELDSSLIEASVMTQSSLGSEVEAVKREYETTFLPLREVQSEEKKKLMMQVQEFEKDIDTNFHIDFIHAMANIRAQNYTLDGMDWIDVKIKAGKIIPALATTTAAIAGLQTLEVLKYLKGCKLEEHKNSFMNLAVPSLMMSEPGLALKTKLKEGLEVTFWDRYELSASSTVTLWELMDFAEKQTHLAGRDIFYCSLPLFLHALEGRDEASRSKNLKAANLLKKIQGNQPNENFQVPEFVDLTITFVEEGVVDENGQEKKLEGVPQLRVTFVPQQ